MSSIVIKNNKLHRDGYPLRSFTGEHPDCNTRIIFASGIAGPSFPWSQFGCELNAAFQNGLKGELKGIKRAGKAVLIGVFSGKLLTRASRGRDKRHITVWHSAHGAPHDEVQDTFFTNTAALRMQRELLDFIIAAVEETKVDALLVFLWESQVVQRNPKFFPWLYNHMEYVRGKAPRLAIGLHNHHHQTISKVKERFDIFWFQEGDSWKEAGLDDLSRIAPGIVGHLNPGKFRPNQPEEMFKKGWQWIVQEAQKSIIGSLVKIGTAGTLYKRWWDRKEAEGDLGDHKDIVSGYQFNEVKKIMTKFYLDVSRELEKYRKSESIARDFGQHLLWSPPEQEQGPTPPTPEPQPPEPTEPDKDDTGKKPTRTILMVILCVVIAAIVFLVIKKPLLGILAAIALATVIVIYILRRKKRKKTKEAMRW